MSDENPTVAAGGPLCGDALRETADWLDTYDEMALAYFDLLDQLTKARATGSPVSFVPADEGVLERLRAAVGSKDQQDDLRRWADELDGRAG